MKRRLIKNVGRAVRGALSELEDFASRVPEKAKGVLGGYPPVNVYERPGAYVVRAEVAGVTADDLDVTVERNSVTIRGTEQEEAGYDEMRRHLGERDQGEFCRTIDLPNDVDEDAEPDATLTQGVLTINIPRAQGSNARRVEVSEPDKDTTTDADHDQEETEETGESEATDEAN